MSYQGICQYLNRDHLGGLLFMSPDSEPGRNKHDMEDRAVKVCVPRVCVCVSIGLTEHTTSLVTREWSYTHACVFQVVHVCAGVHASGQSQSG